MTRLGRGAVIVVGYRRRPHAPDCVFDVAVEEEVDGPAAGVTDEVRDQTSVERGKTALGEVNAADDAERTSHARGGNPIN